MLEVFSLLVGISLLWNARLCQSVDHHCYCVMPTSGIVENITNPCYNSCHPLMYYANLKDDFEDNSTFYFLPGIHLMSGSVMSIANAKNITLGGYSNSSGDRACGFPGSMPVATVECQEDAGFHFRYIKYLSIVGIKINNCGYDSYRGKYMNAIVFYLVWDLCVHGLEVHDAEGVGIYGYEVVGNSVISNSLIDNSTPNGSNYTSGNIHFYYEYKSKKEYSHSLSVINTNITNGKNTQYQPSHRPHAGGIFIYLKTTNAIQILLENMTLSENTGYNGGNVALEYLAVGDSWPSTITIQNCKFLNGYARGFGAGLYAAFIALYNSTYSDNTSRSTEVLRVIDSKFENNEAMKVGAGTYIQLHENQHFNTVANISFINCCFRNNFIHSKTDGRGGSAVNIINFRIPDYIPHPLAQYRISFSSCNFTENGARKITNHLIGSGAFYVEENAITNLTDCRFFDNNNCTGVSAVHSNLLLHGDIEISNNTAVNGGGIVLCANSIMYLSDDVIVTISNNNATQYGGGIYAEFECSQAIPPCFFQVNSTLVHLNKTVFLLDNTAGSAGSALYGGSIDNCYYYGPYNDGSRMYVFDDLFQIESLPNDASSNITSNPLRVCFCEDDFTVNCNKSSVLHKVYSGGDVNVTAVVVGQREGPVPGVVIAQLSGTHDHDVYKLGLLQDSQIISLTNCTNLSYTVYSNTSGGNETIMLSVQDSDFRSFSRRQPRTVDIELEVMPCPPGFSLNAEMSRPTCQCMKKIQGLKKIVCNITTTSIVRSKYTTWWIGFGNYSEDEVPVMYCKFCPFDFCVTSDDVHIKPMLPESQDSQCANNRTGTLCGACKSDKSNVLGSSRCIDCNERTIAEFLLLILLFAVLGVILILFLGILNLTVSEGTLNAIIFYMNIVRVNTTIFFPKQDTCIVSSWLEVFVAWMNLDLGIEMCFYNGMGAVGKTALHFMFPFYLWILAGLIIYLSKKSSSITKLLGKNTIKVLATLILYSYAKLLRTIIDIWKVSEIKSSDGPPSSVWAMDGNISYFHDRRHTILFGFAVIVAAVTLPYTFALLCIQCLRRMPKMKIFFWVNKLKPFFDAYTGPYKDQYHFWTGFLLLVRIFFFVAIVINTTKSHIFSLTLIIGTASLLFLLVQSGIYKMWILNKCEAFAFFNLIIFAALTTYDMRFAYSNDIPAILCVGSMFLLFCGVVIYHVYKLFSDTQWCGKMKVWLMDKRWPWMKRKPIRSLILNHSGVDELSSSDSELDPILANAPPVIRYDEYREPLIESGEGT